MRLLHRLHPVAAALVVAACAGEHLQPYPPRDEPALFERRFTVAELHADIAAWFDGIAARHPDLDARLPPAAFARTKAEVVARVTHPMTRREFFRTVGTATAVFRDGHSGLLYAYPESDADRAAGGRRFPLRVRWHEGEVRVTHDASPSDPVPIDSRLLSINGTPVERLLDSLSAYARGETMALRRSIVVDELGEWLWQVPGWSDRFDVVFEHAGRQHQRMLRGITREEAARSPSRDEETLPSYRRIDAGTGLLDVPYFGADEDAFGAALDAAHDSAVVHAPRVLVVDLRRNPGGSTDQVETLLARLTARPCPLAAQVLERRNAANLRWWERSSRVGAVVEDDQVPVVQPAGATRRFPGDVRVLISPYTYSAAIVMATAVQDCNVGVLIGEETGGFANQTAQIHFFDLPNTRLRAFAPTRLVLRPSGVRDVRPVVPTHVVSTSAGVMSMAQDAALLFAAQPTLPTGTAPR
ncbi:MAG: S41 family peptidase [Gemmatimonadaceae bacterium]|jgi:hypothetical protein|nr:S41 family peptidase [Gemmatimonadaceae bacterium]